MQSIILTKSSEAQHSSVSISICVPRLFLVNMENLFYLIFQDKLFYWFVLLYLLLQYKNICYFLSDCVCGYEWDLCYNPVWNYHIKLSDISTQMWTAINLWKNVGSRICPLCENLSIIVINWRLCLHNFILWLKLDNRCEFLCERLITLMFLW